MALLLEDKKAVVKQVAEVASSASSVIAAEYRGLTVGQMTALRSKAREQGVHVQVVRNTLARIALADTDFNCMKDALVGPLFLAFSREEPGSAARILRDFAKDNDKLIVKAISLSGQLLDASKLEAIASLPTREEALTKLAYVTKAPVTQFVRTLNEVNTKLVRVLAAIRDKKQSS